MIDRPRVAALIFGGILAAVGLADLLTISRHFTMWALTLGFVLLLLGSMAITRNVRPRDVGPQ
jgi:hypothetical protein